MAETRLVFSDLHLDRSADRDPELCSRLLDCLAACGPELTEVLFLGDVFDAYMDYARRPDPATRLFAPIVEYLRERGVEISYFAGNHDAWHLSGIRDMYGIHVLSRPETRIIDGRRIWFSHGDEWDVRGVWGRLARHLMRTDAYYFLYRSVLPASIGQVLPRSVSRRFGTTVLRPWTVEMLRKGARRVLEAGEHDVVIFGHSHVQEDAEFPEGRYVNAGSWYVDLSYLEIGPNTIQMLKWDPESGRAVEAAPGGG